MRSAATIWLCGGRDGCHILIGNPPFGGVVETSGCLGWWLPPRRGRHIYLLAAACAKSPADPEAYGRIVPVDMPWPRSRLRYNIQRRLPNASDYLILLAWLCTLVTSSADVYALRLGWPADLLLSFANYEGSTEDYEAFNKYWYFSGYPFYVGFYVCKFAILGLYLDMFPQQFIYRRYALYGTIAFTVSGCIVTILVLALSCLPMSRIWSFNPENVCPSTQTFQILWSVHFVSDILIFILPFPVLRQGKRMAKSVKVSLYVTFGLGIIDIGVCLGLRFLLVQLTLTTITLASLNFYSAIDLYICLIIACLPPLRPYLRILFPNSNAVQNKGKLKGTTTASTATGHQSTISNHQTSGWLSPIPPAAKASRLGSSEAVHDGSGAGPAYELEPLPHVTASREMPVGQEQGV
ncbi:hypothetical protein RB597_005698 [Gaeumannomyces tritici]